MPSSVLSSTIPSSSPVASLSSTDRKYRTRATLDTTSDQPSVSQRCESQARSRSRPRRRAFQARCSWCGDRVNGSVNWDPSPNRPLDRVCASACAHLTLYPERCSLMSSVDPRCQSSQRLDPSVYDTFHLRCILPLCRMAYTSAFIGVAYAESTKIFTLDTRLDGECTFEDVEDSMSVFRPSSLHVARRRCRHAGRTWRR